MDCILYGRSVQERDDCVKPHNIECYKFHNYGHTTQNCRSVMEPSIKENIDAIYKKVWIRKEK
jgi:hypothetical protein